MNAFNEKTDFVSHRIEGIAREGNVPFSVPLISHIEGNLYQGGCKDGVSLRVVARPCCATKRSNAGCSQGGNKMHWFQLPSAHWLEDCQRWRGQLLLGPYAHWCHDWDELPTDLWCLEITCCSCYSSRTFRLCRAIMDNVWHWRELWWRWRNKQTDKEHTCEC